MPPRRRPQAGPRTDLPPLKILRKILLLQTAYYATATVLILFTTAVYGTEFSMNLVLNWDVLRGDVTLGWILGLVWVLNGLIGVISLLLLISRSKLIPDFALTIHFLHLIATSLYSHSIPSTWLWWGVQVVSATLMVFLGIWACQWRELKPISFGGHRSQQQQQRQQQEQRQRQEQQQQRHQRSPSGFSAVQFPYPYPDGSGSGSGRGRGRNGSSEEEYEMVQHVKDGGGSGSGSGEGV